LFHASWLPRSLLVVGAGTTGTKRKQQLQPAGARRVVNGFNLFGFNQGLTWIESAPAGNVAGSLISLNWRAD
jgi:hypothetical protein